MAHKNLQMTPTHFVLALTISEIFTFKKLDGGPNDAQHGGDRNLNRLPIAMAFDMSHENRKNYESK